MKNLFEALIVIWALLFYTGCGGDDAGGGDCKAAMSKAVVFTAKDVTKYDSNGYHSWSYYWNDHIKTFTWGDYTNGCKVSTYRF